jgi:hypothetical protein
VIDGLCQAVAKHIARDPTSGRLIVLIWQALRTRFSRFAALAARFEAGKLLPPRPRPARTRREAGSSPSDGEGERRKKPRKISFDRAIADYALFGTWRLGWVTRRPAWLPRLMPELGLGVYAAHLRGLLDQPEMVALLRVSPQARALLRPLYRMLMFDSMPDILRGPPRVRAPKPEAPATEAPTVARKARRRWFLGVPGLPRPRALLSPDRGVLKNA